MNQYQLENLSFCVRCLLRGQGEDQKLSVGFGSTEGKTGARDKSSFRGMCRQKPNGCKLEKMGDEEVETVPTDNSEVLLESEAERSGGTWRGM